ncbi:MAG: hypothetical protein JNM56_21570 [Planctomycetia bacterium]|nr:hypothetical protein [Planctomycetia bacterium]
MNRSELCRELASAITADTATATAASQAAIDQMGRVMGIDPCDGSLVSFKEQHTRVMLSLAADIEELYAQKFEASMLTEEELHWLIEMQQSPVPRKLAKVVVELLGSEEMQRLIEKVNAAVMLSWKPVEQESVLCV